MEVSKDTTGLQFSRTFTQEGVDVFSMFEWDIRKIEMKGTDGEVIYKQDVVAPKSWSDQSVQIVASKYFYGDLEKGDDPTNGGREFDIKQLIVRVADTISQWGLLDGYFDQDTHEIFRDELRYMLLGQYGAFNSPVWFNVGLHEKYGITEKSDKRLWGWVKDSIKQVDPYVYGQSSACFIIGVEDSVDDIWELMSESARLFKYGSGVGADWSKIRSSKEKITGGGVASGPVSFMRVQDETGGTIKSGGKNRRSAIMETLKCTHPDIMEFVNAKQLEEKKAWALIDAGYDGSFNGDAYGSVAFQNVNHSVRLTDEFMEALSNNEYTPQFDVNGNTIQKTLASEIMNGIAEGTHICGDPGVQYEDTIQEWHTCPNSGPINSSNPCCFVGETLVDTSEGRIRIDELVRRSENGEELPYAFSYDRETGLPVMNQINKAWKAGNAEHLVRVVTDKGVTVECTPEHKFLTYGGEYVEAQDLTPGTRLRKLCRAQNPKRSNRFLIYGKEGRLEKGEYQSRFIWSEINGPIPEGYHIHHTNGDATDDRLSNLELIEAKKHWSDHGKGSNNPRYLNASDELLVRVYDEALSFKNKTHKNNIELNVSKWNKAINSLELNGIVPKARSGRIMGMDWGDFVDHLMSLADVVNDKIVSVTPFESNLEPVYDIEVEATKNFFVSNGETLHSICVSNSEYMFLDGSACNLASLNLLKFYNISEDIFDPELLEHASRIFITAMDILVDRSGYPSKIIAQNSHDYRPLGLGFTNLGALLMTMGVPYDSDEGRSWAGSLMAIIHGSAYSQSSRVAKLLGSFNGYEANEEPMLKVMAKHRDEVYNISEGVYYDVFESARELLNVALDEGKENGYRNSQVTVLAPTGTISFYMGCDTTGIEPELGLVKYKLLAGKTDSMMKIVNGSIPNALVRLGYNDDDVLTILEHIEEKETLDGCESLKEEHLPVFATSFGTFNTLDYKAHLKMMAACQPFISGAISKTVNMPESCTVEEIKEAYVLGWELGLKAVAVYRENSKRSQPLNLKETPKESGELRGLDYWIKYYSKDGPEGEIETPGKITLEMVENLLNKKPIHEGDGFVLPSTPEVIYKPVRKKLPDDRKSLTHKFSVGGHEGYLHIGLYPDTNLPGEIFITMSKQGSTISGMMDAFATSVSLCLQWGVPLEKLIEKFTYTRFEPSGFNSNPDIKRASTSIIDYIFSYLDTHIEFQQHDDFIDADTEENHTFILEEVDHKKTLDTLSVLLDNGGVIEKIQTVSSDAPPCSNCGTITVRAGSCHTCPSCGNSTGCG